MNPTQKRFIIRWLDLSLQAYLKGDIAKGDRYMSNALTFAAPIGALIAQCYN